MKARLFLFNNILLAVAAVLGGDCAMHGTSMHDPDFATMDIFMEGRAADNLRVEVGWDKFPMYIEAEPAFTEEDLSKAAWVKNADGTYEIQLTFTDHGALALEMQTKMQQGRHLVILSAFPPEGPKKEPQKGAPATGEKPVGEKPRDSAWLAAVLIPRNGFSNGSIRFKPDATPEEVERIVLGVNKRLTAMHK